MSGQAQPCSVSKLWLEPLQHSLIVCTAGAFLCPWAVGEGFWARNSLHNFPDFLQSILSLLQLPGYSSANPSLSLLCVTLLESWLAHGSSVPQGCSGFSVTSPEEQHELLCLNGLFYPKARKSSVFVTGFNSSQLWHCRNWNSALASASGVSFPQP